MASLTERQARALARQQAAAEKAKAAYDAMSPERKARIKAAEKAKADAAAAAAAKRAANKGTTKFPNLGIEVPNSELNKPIYAFSEPNAIKRNSGGIMSPTVNPIYTTYGDS